MNYRYDEDMICNSGRIYMDSSTFMNIESLRLFIEKTESIFYRINKKIVVTSNVYLELKRHCYSEIEEKRDRACQALELIEQYSNLFDIDSIEGKEMMEAFADPELLSQITLNKGRYTQLLITYDRRLGSDAFQLNNQESNHGKRIFVCYVNRYGNLQRCECTKRRINRERSTAQCRKPASIVECEVKEKSMFVKDNTSDVQQCCVKKWKTPTAVAVGVASGIVIDQVVTRYIKPLLSA